MRKFFLALSGLACLALAACSSNSGNGTTNPSTTPYGYQTSTGTGTGLWFTVAIMPECGAAQATVSLSNQQGSSAFQTMAVTNGGSTNFVVGQGTYMVTVQAGACNLSGQIQFYGTVQTFNICVGNSCSGQQSGYTTATYSPYLFRALKEVPCNWGVYGCQEPQDPGAGGIAIKRANISFSSKKDSDLNLNLTFSKGNNLLMASPALGSSGWDLTAKAAGGIVSSKISYDDLVYDAQVDQNLLQFKDGFCGKKDELPAKMSAYLSTSGFSAKSVAAFEAQWATRMPPNDEFCVYPQNEEEIRDVVNYKSSVSVPAHRVWFILIPQENAAVSKIRKFPAQYAALNVKPKVDAIAALKKANSKNRAVANDPDVSSEEFGVGFLIER